MLMLRIVVGLAAVTFTGLGCRTPSVGPSACGPSSASRTSLVVRQVAADTAVSAKARPGRAVHATLTELAATARTWSAGLFRKRIAAKVPLPMRSVTPILPPGCDGEPLDDIAFHLDGADALAALDRVIDGATCRLDVLMYIWASDRIGWHVAHRLAVRAGPELPVRVLVDGGGTLLQGKPDDARAADVNRAVCWLAEQPFVEVIRIRDPGFRFDHRKLVIADDQLAWAGGRNLSRVAFEDARDVSFTVAGPVAGQLAAIFETAWRENGGPGRCQNPVIEHPSIQVVETRPGQFELARCLYQAVRNAERSICLENPNLADPRMVAMLIEARRRGVDVRVVIPTDSQSSLFDRANRVTANRFLRAGVRVYRYPGFSHVKAMSVDGTWAYTGSGNFDPLSFRHNREIGLVITDGPTVREIDRRLFLPDFDPTWELSNPLDVSFRDRLAEVIVSTVG